jgi:polysaccharide export outer membrane protein
MQIRLGSVFIFFAAGGVALAQAGATRPQVLEAKQTAPVSGNSEAGYAAPSNYKLGPDDEVTLFVSDVDEISNKPMRIDMRGDINIPMAGRVHAAGLTADRLETEIENRLKKYLKDPDVVVSIKEFRSQPISVLGAVDKPGVHQLEGRKTLFEVLSMAGGLRADSGNTVKITRSLEWGRIPLPDAKDDATGQFNVASVKVKGIMDGSDPAANIMIKPEDVITVPKADLVYAVGSVKRPGGFPLNQNETLSTLQVLSLAEGLDKAAAPKKARIMRVVPGTTSRMEIPVDLQKLMAGKSPDLPLQSDDILFVPNSAAKNAGGRAMEAAIQIATGVAIYGRY